MSDRLRGKVTSAAVALAVVEEAYGATFLVAATHHLAIHRCANVNPSFLAPQESSGTMGARWTLDPVKRPKKLHCEKCTKRWLAVSPSAILGRLDDYEPRSAL